MPLFVFCCFVGTLLLAGILVAGNYTAPPGPLFPNADYVAAILKSKAGARAEGTGTSHLRYFQNQHRDASY